MTRVLYAEDDENVAFMLQFKLEDAGYEVVLAEDGQEAWDRFQAEPFPVALVDVMMPRMDGFELCRRLKAHEQAPVVILITARDRPEDRRAGEAAGADDYLAKPVSPQGVIDVIERFLGG